MKTPKPSNLSEDLDIFFHQGYRQAIKDSIECLKKWQAFDCESDGECPQTIGDLLEAAEDAIDDIAFYDTPEKMTAKGRYECLLAICENYPECDDIAVTSSLEAFLTESHLIEVDGGSFTLFRKNLFPKLSKKNVILPITI